ncbi:hypothetical protein I317_06276 [Kwoniella heveanensis CBS 569]|nr:hypothetical protein I317_06276 [Kwoniella heveanensis CBS 569]
MAESLRQFTGFQIRAFYSGMLFAKKYECDNVQVIVQQWLREIIRNNTSPFTSFDTFIITSNLDLREIGAMVIRFSRAIVYCKNEWLTIDELSYEFEPMRMEYNIWRQLPVAWIHAWQAAYQICRNDRKRQALDFVDTLEGIDEWR